VESILIDLLFGDQGYFFAIIGHILADWSYNSNHWSSYQEDWYP